MTEPIVLCAECGESLAHVDKWKRQNFAVDHMRRHNVPQAQRRELTVVWQAKGTTHWLGAITDWVLKQLEKKDGATT